MAPAQTLRSRLVYVLLLLCICQCANAQRSQHLALPSLEHRVRSASRESSYQHPSIDELRAAERLFTRTLRADEPVEVLRDAWAGSHFELKAVELHDQPLWLLRESEGHQVGRGFYAFRPNATMPVAIQSPHSFGDRRTRELTARLFVDSDFAAAAFNTVHRDIMDAAHSHNCLLNSFTTAFLRVHRDDAFVCQLHGFSRSKRTTDRGRNSDLIVSNGTRLGAHWTQRTVTVFRDHWPNVAVRLFPDDVSELGATTNHQGRIILQSGLGRFLHLEMSAELRDDLYRLPAPRGELLKAIEDSFRTGLRVPS